jgi:PIN domain nuclease of toxin-antitoxin system
MTCVLLDTHSFVWSLLLSSALSPAARAMIEAADAVYVAPVSFYEITQKHRLGKWPELDLVIDRLLRFGMPMAP